MNQNENGMKEIIDKVGRSTVEVSPNYNKSEIEVEYTGKMIWYRVYGIETKVYNYGWEVKQTW